MKSDLLTSLKSTQRLPLTSVVLRLVRDAKEPLSISDVVAELHKARSHEVPISRVTVQSAIAILTFEGFLRRDVTSGKLELLIVPPTS